VQRDEHQIGRQRIRLGEVDEKQLPQCWPLRPNGNAAADLALAFQIRKTGGPTASSNISSLRPEHGEAPPVLLLFSKDVIGFHQS